MVLQTFTHLGGHKMGGDRTMKDNAASVSAIVDVSFGKGSQQVSRTHTVLKSKHVPDLMSTNLLAVFQSWCATACTSGVLKVWDLATGICRCTCIHPAGVTKVWFNALNALARCRHMTLIAATFLIIQTDRLAFIRGGNHLHWLFRWSSTAMGSTRWRMLKRAKR